MKKHLFFCGCPTRLVSAMLREELGPALSIAGGYVTDTISEPGTPLSVALLPAAAAGGVTGFRKHIIYEERDGRPQKDNEVFRTEAERLLREAIWYPFAVLDRFGGYELVVPQYRQALADLLSADLPLIGVVFERSEALELCRGLGLGERYEMLADRLTEALRDDPDTLLFPVTPPDLDAARRLVRQWTQSYIYA